MKVELAAALDRISRWKTNTKEKWQWMLTSKWFVAGTGHGVGAALNVHEGPQSVSARYGNMTGLQAGMVISNEPGYYEDRAFGIRIEVCTRLFFSQLLSCPLKWCQWLPLFLFYDLFICLYLLNDICSFCPQNLLVIREEETANRYGGVTFLGFERLSFVPIQVFRTLIYSKWFVAGWLCLHWYWEKSLQLFWCCHDL